MQTLILQCFTTFFVLLALASSLAHGQFYSSTELPADLDEVPEELDILEELPSPADSELADQPFGPEQQSFELGEETDGEFIPGFPVQGDPAPVESSGTWLTRGFWFVEQDVVLLNRSIFENKTLATDRTDPDLTPGNQVVGLNRNLVVEHNAPDVVANARLTLGRFLFRDAKNNDNFVEFTFLGAGEWFSRGSQQSVNRNDLTTPFGSTRILMLNGVGSSIPLLGGFNRADFQTFEFETDLYSYELNYSLRHRLGRDQMTLEPDGHWVRRVTPANYHSYLFGLRLIQMNESLDWHSQAFPRERDLFPGGGTRQAFGEFSTRTRNSLVGFQVGGELTHERGRFSVGLRGKAGPYINFSSQRKKVLIEDNGYIFYDPTTATVVIRGSSALGQKSLDVDHHEEANDASIAFVGELGFFMHYHLHPNITLRAAYEGLWLNTVALATEQISLDPSEASRVVTGAGQFYQGGSVGVEFYW